MDENDLKQLEELEELYKNDEMFFSNDEKEIEDFNKKSYNAISKAIYVIKNFKKLSNISNDKVYIKNETNLPLEKVIDEVNTMRSKYINKEEFMTMITNLKFDSVYSANLTFITGYRCLFDEKDNIRIDTYDKDIQINY